MEIVGNAAAVRMPGHPLHQTSHTLICTYEEGLRVSGEGAGTRWPLPRMWAALLSCGTIMIVILKATGVVMKRASMGIPSVVVSRFEKKRSEYVRRVTAYYVKHFCVAYPVLQSK